MEQVRLARWIRWWVEEAEKGIGNWESIDGNRLAAKLNSGLQQLLKWKTFQSRHARFRVEEKSHACTCMQSEKFDRSYNVHTRNHSGSIGTVDLGPSCEFSHAPEMEQAEQWNNGGWKKLKRQKDTTVITGSQYFICHANFLNF